MTRFSNAFAEKVSALFDDKQLSSLAKDTGFIKRKRQLTPKAFLGTLLVGVLDKYESTLKLEVIALKKYFGVSIRPQSYDEHINRYAVEFIKEMITKCLKSQLNQVVPPQVGLDKWRRVILHDSTQFKLPNRLKSLFKGFGGNLKCDSLFKVQNACDLKSGAIEELEVGDARLQDATSGKKVVPQCGEDDLLIRDLGYFELDGFQKMGCDYLSRLKPKTTLYDEHGEKIDLKKIQAKMKKNALEYLDMPVTIGVKKKVNTRIVISLAAKQVKDERIRKATKQNKSYGNHTSKEFKLYAGFNFFITNVGKEDLTAEQIMALYRVRWQIELMFKGWKSYFKLNVFKDCKPHRVLCYVYSSLLMILINWQIVSICMKLSHLQTEKYSSMLQAMKYQVVLREEIRLWIKGEFSEICEDIKKHFLHIYEHIQLSKRKYRANYIDIVEKVNGKYPR